LFHKCDHTQNLEQFDFNAKFKSKPPLAADSTHCSIVKHSAKVYINVPFHILKLSLQWRPYPICYKKLLHQPLLFSQTQNKTQLSKSTTLTNSTPSAMKYAICIRLFIEDARMLLYILFCFHMNHSAQETPFPQMMTLHTFAHKPL